MALTALQTQIDRAEEDMRLLGFRVESAVEQAMTTLHEGDSRAARAVVEQERSVRRRRFALEKRCLGIMATQQPLARDLRRIVAILHVIMDLERIGGHARGIASIALLHQAGVRLSVHPLLDAMAEHDRRTLRRSLEAFRDRDAGLARSIWRQDDELDRLYRETGHALLLSMLSSPREIERGTHLTWVAHNLERIGDRVTNICERVVYLVEGKMDEADL